MTGDTVTTEDGTRQTVPIAVIIPCYNYGRFLGETIESVLAQTVKPQEIIVVDDGSTDNTREVCQRYEDVRYIWKENGGLSSARNHGLAESSAEYVLFLDADDALVRDALRKLWDAMSLVRPKAHIVFGRAEVVSMDGGAKESSPVYLTDPEEVKVYVETPLSEDVAILSRDILVRLVRSNIVPACSVLTARSIYDDVGLWNEQYRYNEDREMWLRIASRYRIGYVDRTVANVRKHGQNITAPKNWLRNHLMIQRILLDMCEAPWASRALKRLVKRQYGIGSYIIAQRYADHGELRQAIGWMRKAARVGPKRAKALVFLHLYGLRWLCSGRCY